MIQIREPSYGRYLEEFHPGEVFVHPRGLTFHASFVQEFATTFMEACPLYLNEFYPRALGFDGQLVPPLMMLASTLSLGVQNESEKAIAHLGYYHVRFPNPAFVGDSLRSITQVVSRKDRAPGEPGIVHVRTWGINQNRKCLVSYERKILIPSQPRGLTTSRFASKTENMDLPFDPEEEVSLDWIPRIATKTLPGWTAGKTYFEDFTEGEVIIHPNGRTVTDEHIPWTYRLGNTHPLHFDSIYSHSQKLPMGGEPIVFGGLVFAWIVGLASRDTAENAIWDLGYHDGYHLYPVRSEDTLFAISQVLEKKEGPIPGTGTIRFKLIGLANQHGHEALEQFGESLLLSEQERKSQGREKIEAKIFEIERSLLIRKRT